MREYSAAYPLGQLKQGEKLLQEARDSLDRFAEVCRPDTAYVDLDAVDLSTSPTPVTSSENYSYESALESQQEDIALDPDNITGGRSARGGSGDWLHDNLNGSSCGIDNASTRKCASGEILETESLEGGVDVMDISTGREPAPTNATFHQQCSTGMSAEGVGVGVGREDVDGGKVGALFGDLLTGNCEKNGSSEVDGKEENKHGVSDEDMEKSMLEFENFLGEFNSPDKFLSEVLHMNSLL